MLPKNLRHNPGRVRAIVYAVLVHAAVIGVAVIGFRWSMQPPATDQVVQAVAVPEAPVSKPAEANKRNKEEEQEQERQQVEAEKRRQAELREKQEEEQTQQRLTAERKKKEAEEKERQKQAAEEQRRQKQAAEETRRQEEKQRQKLAEQALREQLASEEKQRSDAVRSARAATEVDKYRALIRSRVSRSWNRPSGVAKGLKCTVSVRLAPGGEVLSAHVVRSSGNAIFDRSVENAVYKAAPLPLPEDPTLFDNFREIEFLFSPEE